VDYRSLRPECGLTSAPLLWHNHTIQPKSAFSCFPRVHRADLEGQHGSNWRVRTELRNRLARQFGWANGGRLKWAESRAHKRRLVCNFRHRFGIPALRVPFIIVCKRDPACRFDNDPVEIKRATEEGAAHARASALILNCPLAALRI
jgi:hypothetical protein